MRYPKFKVLQIYKKRKSRLQSLPNFLKSYFLKPNSNKFTLKHPNTEIFKFLRLLVPPKFTLWLALQLAGLTGLV